MCAIKIRAASARSLAVASILLMAGDPSPARAAGILDAACTPGQGPIVTDFQGAPGPTTGRGHGMAAFVRGKDAAQVDTDYLMLVWSKDSGQGDGGISFWNWDSPSSWGSPPKLRYKLTDPQLREAHVTPVTNMFANDWRTWVLQATNGFSVYNLDSVAAPVLVKNTLVPGATQTDYSGGAVWFLALAAPYLYVAEADEGLKIYKFTDPADASKLMLLSSYDKDWFGHRVNQVWVRGNRIVVAAVQDNYGVTIADISNPVELANPKLYNLQSSPPIRNAYGWTLNGNALYAASKLQGSLAAGLTVHELDPESLELKPKKEVTGQCSSGGYAAAQDDNVFVGLSSCVHKFKRDTKGTTTTSDDGWSKVSPPASPNPPGAWTIGIVGADNDFPTPFGNALFLGNDHNGHARQQDHVSFCGRGHHQAGRQRAQSGRRCDRRRHDLGRRPVVHRQSQAVDDQHDQPADPGQEHAGGSRRLLQLSAQHRELPPGPAVRCEHRVRGGGQEWRQGSGRQRRGRLDRDLQDSAVSQGKPAPGRTSGHAPASFSSIARRSR